METVGGRLSLHGYVAVFTFLVAISEGSECEPPSRPQCFRRTHDDKETEYRCEWLANATGGDVLYHLCVDNASVCKITSETWTKLHEDEIVNNRLVDIWVEARVGGSSCRSNSTMVKLAETIKYEAPRNISASWSNSDLSVSWGPAESDPAVAEIWFGKYQHPVESWEKRETAANLTHTKPAMYQAVIGNLSEDSSYQLRLRHRSRRAGNPLWSDWSPLVTFPAKLQHEPDVTMETVRLEGFRAVKLKWKPVQHAAAAVGGVTYVLEDTQSSHGCPCPPKTRHLNHTHYTVKVSYSAVNISVTARNAVGNSPPAIVHVSAEPEGDLQACTDTLLDEKLDRSMCLQWYEYHHGDSPPENLMTLSGRKTKPERKEIRNKVKDHVRYLYVEHSCVNGKPRTLRRCLFYQKEDVPHREPQDLKPFRETPDSATLSWRAIPVADQRGFLTHYSLCIAAVGPQEEHKGHVRVLCDSKPVRVTTVNWRETEKNCYNISASLTKCRLENLMVGVKYNISLAGATREGEGPPATGTIHALEEKHVNVWFSLILLSLFLLLTTSCSVLCRRIQTKVFSPMPTPVTLDFSSFPEAAQQETPGSRGERDDGNKKKKEEEEEVEEVHEVTLLPLHPEEGEKSPLEGTEETTVLRWDDDSDGDADDERGDSTPSEGTGDGRLSPASTDGAPRGSTADVQCVDELARLTYRTGLVLDSS